MKREMRAPGKFLSVILAVILLWMSLPSAQAANYSKVEKSYDIAVVFDNSGSMYNNEAWCRAKYAMEIFASMLNYDKGDKLKIFTMWGIATDGSKPGQYTNGSFSADIGSSADIDKISNLYTIIPGGTPFAPVTEAYEYLKNSDAVERWLLVLTDGDFNQEARGVKANFDLQSRFLSLASQDIKIQYLGFNDAPSLASDEGRGFFSKKSTDTGLKDDLIDICNAIFQRSVLPANRLNGTELNLDLSMKTLIVFAQGADASVTGLTDENGNSIGITLDSGRRKYSEIKAGNYDDAPADRTLSGQVVTFAACPKGKYTLHHSGADAIRIFYEPDVDIRMTITDSDGETTDPFEGQIVSGDYVFANTIVDSTTGEDVLHHELMGNDVKLSTHVRTPNGTTEYPNNSTVHLDSGETYIYVEGTYLGKYKMTTEGDPDFFPIDGLDIPDPVPAFEIDAEAQQKDRWYNLRDHENWLPVRVDMRIDGQPLTAEQMQNIVLSAEGEDGVSLRREMLPDDSAYILYVGQNDIGEYVEPETGKYKLRISADYTDEHGTVVSAEDDAGFEVRRYSRIWRVLVWILGILLLFLLWLLFMLQKVMPLHMCRDQAAFHGMTAGSLGSETINVDYRRKQRTLTIEGPRSVDYDEQCSVTFDLRPIDNRFTPPHRRRVAMTGINSMCIDAEIQASATSYVYFNGRWIKRTHLRAVQNGGTAPQIDQPFSSCSPRFTMTREGNTAVMTCSIRTTR